MEPVILVLVMLLGLWFLVIMPQRRRQKQLQKTVEALQSGSRVMLAGGLFGTVASVGEKTMRVEIAPGVEVEVVKQAVIETVKAPAADPVAQDSVAQDSVAQDSVVQEWAADDPSTGDDPERSQVSSSDEPGTPADPQKPHRA